MCYYWSWWRLVGGITQSDDHAWRKFVDDIRNILTQAWKKAYASISFAMIEGYWLIGKRIVEEEQLGKERAQYGKEILRRLAEDLAKGFSGRILRYIRKCYLTFPDWQHLAHACAKLDWCYIRAVPRVSAPFARQY